MQGYKGLTPPVKLGHLYKPLSILEPPVGLGEAIVATPEEVHFPLLPLGLPLVSRILPDKPPAGRSSFQSLLF